MHDYWRNGHFKFLNINSYVHTYVRTRIDNVFLSLKYENRLAEKRWIEEKDHFLRELDKLKEVGVVCQSEFLPILVFLTDSW